MRIKYDDVAVEIVSLQTMLLLLFCEQKDLMQIRFTLRCIQYMVTRYYEANSKGLCKKMLDWQKFASATEVQ